MNFNVEAILVYNYTVTRVRFDLHSVLYRLSLINTLLEGLFLHFICNFSVLANVVSIEVVYTRKGQCWSSCRFLYLFQRYQRGRQIVKSEDRIHKTTLKTKAGLTRTLQKPG